MSQIGKKEINKLILILKKNLKKNKGKIPLHEPTLNINEKKYLNDCIKKNHLSSVGNYSNKFIKELKKITESKYVILTNSGTSALHLALKSSGIKENEEVLMPSLNYIASANSALYCRSSPHFIEVSEKTLGVDPYKLEIYLKKICIVKSNFSINRKTKKRIRALICLHTFGHSCEIDKIKKICNKYKIFLIEDSAEAIGSFFKKQHLGTFGNIGILSFNGNKTITSASGGAIITNNKKIAELVLHLSQNAKFPHSYLYDYDQEGYNYKPSNITSAIGFAQIKEIRKIINSKREIFNKYKNIFTNISFLKLFKEPKNSKSNYWLQTLLLNKPNLIIRNQILTKTNKIGIGTRPIWKPLHKLNFLSKFQKSNLDVTNNLEKRIINIPSSSHLKI